MYKKIILLCIFIKSIHGMDLNTVPVDLIKAYMFPKNENVMLSIILSKQSKDITEQKNKYFSHILIPLTNLSCISKDLQTKLSSYVKEAGLRTLEHVSFNTLSTYRQAPDILFLKQNIPITITNGKIEIYSSGTEITTYLPLLDFQIELTINNSDDKPSLLLRFECDLGEAPNKRTFMTCVKQYIIRDIEAYFNNQELAESSIISVLLSRHTKLFQNVGQKLEYVPCNASHSVFYRIKGTVEKNNLIIPISSINSEEKKYLNYGMKSTWNQTYLNK